MAHKNILFQEVQRDIARHVIESTANRYFMPGKAQKLSHRSFLTVWLYMHIMGERSLRSAVTSLNHRQESLYHLGLGDGVRLSTVSDAMRKRNSLFFKDLFMTELLKTNRKFKKLCAFPLRALDSTEIFVPFEKFSWDTLRSKGRLIKVHVEIEGITDQLLSVDITSGAVGDITHARNKSYPAGTILLKDRGYCDAKWWKKLNKNGVFFITRLRSDIVHYTVSTREITEHENISKEKIIQFMGPDSSAYDENLRLITINNPARNETFEIVTNNFDLPAESVAALYKSRWQIELFFKWIKQHLKVKAFIGRNENAILQQIWTAMLVYLIVWRLRQKSKFAGTPLLVFLRFLKARLFCEDSILEAPPPPNHGVQLMLPIIKGKNTGH